MRTPVSWVKVTSLYIVLWFKFVLYMGRDLAIINLLFNFILSACNPSRLLQHALKGQSANFSKSCWGHRYESFGVFLYWWQYLKFSREVMWSELCLFVKLQTSRNYFMEPKEKLLLFINHYNEDMNMVTNYIINMMEIHELLHWLLFYFCIADIRNCWVIALHWVINVQTALHEWIHAGAVKRFAQVQNNRIS